jgi:hypothetical protein
MQTFHNSLCSNDIHFKNSFVLQYTVPRTVKVVVPTSKYRHTVANGKNILWEAFFQYNKLDMSGLFIFWISSNFLKHATTAEYYNF